MSVSTSQVLFLAAIGLIFFNIGDVKRASQAGLVMRRLGVICMALVIGGSYVALHGGSVAL